MADAVKAKKPKRLFGMVITMDNVMYLVGAVGTPGVIFQQGTPEAVAAREQIGLNQVKRVPENQGLEFKKGTQLEPEQAHTILTFQDTAMRDAFSTAEASVEGTGGLPEAQLDIVTHVVWTDERTPGMGFADLNASLAADVEKKPKKKARK